MRTSLRVLITRASLATALGVLAGALVTVVPERSFAAEADKGAEGAAQLDWKSWKADTDANNLKSLQRGARNFTNYCLGCHSLKYERYSRLGKDLEIPTNLLDQFIVQPGDKDANYILTTMPAADAEVWFGKTPPDLSLMARERGPDYLYRFLKTFYLDPTRPTGANNLQLPSTAMPHVLSELEGLKKPVFKPVEKQGEGGKTATEQVFDHFEQVAPGRMNADEYDQFVRDTVNFLSYVGEPTQVQRHNLGVWVVLFLLVFTWLAWLMKNEYWKDVH
jgi:ubiquinol-cytochrome c reductase cytochrome c1 subunit